MKTVKVFKYVHQLDAFLVTEEYRGISENLGLIELAKNRVQDEYIADLEERIAKIQSAL